MELTWLLATSVLVVAGGYVVLQRAPRPGFVRWTFLGVSLFALATRDLFRSRQRGRLEAPRSEVSADETSGRTDRSGVPQLTRFRRRVTGWFR